MHVWTLARSDLAVMLPMRGLGSVEGRRNPETGKAAHAQQQPEPRGGQTSITVRQCGTPDCCLFDGHDGLCSSVVLGRKRVRRAPSWMVQECDEDDTAKAVADEYYEGDPVTQLCVPCWVVPECNEDDATEARTDVYVGVAALTTRTEARSSAHPAENNKRTLPKAIVGTAWQPGKTACVGAGLCEHGRRRFHCKECGGGGICEHRQRRGKCKECNIGSKIT